jgi:hypothetical protein
MLLDKSPELSGSILARLSPLDAVLLVELLPQIIEAPLPLGFLLR